jgi:hypothetical protein
MMVGSMSIAGGGLVTGYAVDNTHKETSEQKNARATVYIIADGSLLGRVLAHEFSAGHAGYDDNHGYSFQLPSALLDGVTQHVIEAHGYDGKFASQSGVLS